MATTFLIDGRHVEVTPALEQYVQEKLSKVSQIFTKQVTTIHVVLSVEEGDEDKRQIAEAEVKIAGDKNRIFAEASSNDLYESIDRLKDKLLAQVHKYHGKQIDHNHDKS